MIENLKGIYETVNFKENTSFRLYNNDEFEDYPPHWHNSMEIIMPLENIYTIDCCNQRIVLQENDIIFIWPCCIHTLYAPESGKRIIFLADINVLNNIKQMATLHTLLSPVTVVTPKNCPETHPLIREAILQIQEEYRKDALFSDLSIYSKMLNIFSLLAQNTAEHAKPFDVTANKQQEYMEKFMYICEYISEHCTEDLSLDDVANLAGFSKYHFSRLFKQFTNVSFYKYLNQKRIALAEKQLSDINNSITDVAINSGFSSMSSFIRMFKQIKNCTPTEFRNMHHGNIKNTVFQPPISKSDV